MSPTGAGWLGVESLRGGAKHWRSCSRRGVPLSRPKNCENNPMQSINGASHHPKTQDLAWLVERTARARRWRGSRGRRQRRGDRHGRARYRFPAPVALPGLVSEPLLAANRNIVVAIGKLGHHGAADTGFG